eukprot:gnl/TRDRNA2_/TRDRNA2_185743_c0_seq1.p1 gnl/TRDRNA2_/TRDRNA2_185743_c0~~gnl/TRDRNA2_/TRDRNA2_185743_c0_seq1.p1  ORF type:complete len:113 (+),score=15.10 gnl/TRDRNA2_/TRDRNA2_185743_c0_seq1:28-366(+)
MAGSPGCECHRDHMSGRAWHASEVSMAVWRPHIALDRCGAHAATAVTIVAPQALQPHVALQTLQAHVAPQAPQPHAGVPGHHGMQAHAACRDLVPPDLHVGSAAQQPLVLST